MPKCSGCKAWFPKRAELEEHKLGCEEFVFRAICSEARSEANVIREAAEAVGTPEAMRAANESIEEIRGAFLLPAWAAI